MRARGQVLALAALLALVLCLAVLATVCLGDTVHERVRLQHTADAAAYSAATAEAQTFNLYAEVNRAHASHYVSAMVWQSLLSHLFFTEAFLTDLLGLTYSFPCLDPQGDWKALCAVARRVPGLGGTLAVLQDITAAMADVTQTFQQGLRAGDDAIDRQVGQELIPSFFEMNGALSAVAQGVMQGTYAQLGPAGQGVAADNDPELAPEDVELDPGGLSRCLLARSHSAAALGRPGEAPHSPFAALSPSARDDRDPVARAKRSMAGVANATRQACDAESPSSCPERFVTARTEVLSLPPELAGLRQLLDRIPKWGQTRLLSHGMGGADGQNFIREPDGAPDVPTGMLAQGDNLGADDVYQFPLGPFACRATDPYDRCWGEPRLNLHQIQHPTDAQRPFRTMLKTSIWALNPEERVKRPGGVHWRVAFPTTPEGPGHVAPRGDRTELGLNQVRRTFFGALSVSVYVANVRPIQDGHHPWPGIAPFPQFEPGQFEAACSALGAGTPTDRPAPREDEFNQPSVWAVLRKAARPASGTGGLAQRLLDVSDPSWGETHAFARAQIYYHRPGDWAEHPNFFNPFWRARLAATLQGRGLAPALQSWVEALPDPLRLQPERVVTH